MDPVTVHLDTFSYFFILLSLYANSNTLIILFSSCAAWNDERCFLALFLVGFFHLCNDYKIRFTSFNSLKINSKCLSVLASILLYLMLRLFLSVNFNMHTPSTGANLMMFSKTGFYFPFGVLTFLEGFWIMVILAIILTVKGNDYIIFYFFVVSALVFILLSGCVTDISRVGTCLFPIVFVCLNYLHRKISQFELQTILLVCLVFSFLIPPIVVCPDWSINFWFSNSNFDLLKKII